VIGRHHARLAISPKLASIDVLQDDGTGSEIQHHSPIGPLHRRIGNTARSPHDRRDLRHRRAGRRQISGDKDLRLSRRPPLFGQAHQRDHSLIRFLGRLAKREDAMMQQDQSLHLRLRFINLCGPDGEGKARHHIRNQRRPSPVHLPADGFTVRLIGDAQDRAGMRMVDELMRKECVQKRLHRRRRRCGIDQV